MAIIAGTRTKVRELALTQRINGWDALELHKQFPHLSMGQIHSALAYFWDHRDALEAEIVEGLRFVDEMRSRGESPFQAELQGRIAILKNYESREFQ